MAGGGGDRLPPPGLGVGFVCLKIKVDYYIACFYHAPSIFKDLSILYQCVCSDYI